MSTRCQLGVFQNKDAEIYNCDVYVYKHSDGYPGKADGSEFGVLPLILPFLEDFQKLRGISDFSYCAARLVQHLTNDSDKTRAYPEFRMLGYGLDCGGAKGIHGDIEFFYHISPEAVKVFQTHNPDDPKTWKLIEEIALEPR